MNVIKKFLPHHRNQDPFIYQPLMEYDFLCETTEEKCFDTPDGHNQKSHTVNVRMKRHVTNDKRRHNCLFRRTSWTIDRSRTLHQGNKSQSGRDDLNSNRYTSSLKSKGHDDVTNSSTADESHCKIHSFDQDEYVDSQSSNLVIESRKSFPCNIFLMPPSDDSSSSIGEDSSNNSIDFDLYQWCNIMEKDKVKWFEIKVPEIHTPGDLEAVSTIDNDGIPNRIYIWLGDDGSVHSTVSSLRSFENPVDKRIDERLEIREQKMLEKKELKERHRQLMQQVFVQLIDTFSRNQQRNEEVLPDFLAERLIL